MKKYIPPFLFIIILIIVSIYYNYHEIALKRPQSTHKWRQSDCASIALNYYQDGMNFLTPETHNLTSDGGTSGKCCASEIPILYYSVASLYKVFGYNEFIYRIFNTLLFFLGLFYLFKLMHYLLKDNFWAIALSILFFTSPLLVYYGNNYLSNSSSLAFSIIAWYYFIRFYFESKPKLFYTSMVVILLAGAFKVTGLFSLFAIGGIYLIELLGLKRFKEDRKLFTKPFLYLLPIISIFLIIGLWLVYAHSYNQTHDCTYFSTTIFPIWELNSIEIDGVLSNIKKVWLDEYFHKSVILFIIMCFLFIIAFFRKNTDLLIYGVLFILAEVIFYILLQFWTFADHDYYVIDVYILPILIVISAFVILKKHSNKLFNAKIFKIAFAIFLLFNINYAHQKINNRYDGWMNDFPERKDIYSISPYLRQIGISPNDTIISIPDGSHVSLYLMNQKGWTEYTDARFNKGTPIRYNRDSVGIQESIDNGARYLIVNGIKELYIKPYLQSYCTNLIGTYNNVLVFNLKSNLNNYNLKKRTVHKVYKCSAEHISYDNQFFYGQPDSTLFQNGATRSNEFAHRGNYSSKLNANSPYGMTIKFNDLENGESLRISVWRKINNISQGGIIASNSPFQYYNNNYKVIQKDSNGWERIEMEVFIESEMENQELGVYLHNPDEDYGYFDDLEIIKYESVLNIVN